MTIKNKQIFILGISRFDGVIESTSYTSAKYLAKDNDVFYIDFPYTLKDCLSGKSPEEEAQFQRRKNSFFSEDSCLIKTDCERLKVILLPPVLPINFLSENFFYRWLLRMNEQIIANRIASVISRQKIENFIFINSFNFHYPNVGLRLKPSLHVYHCVDPLVVNYDRKHGIQSEKVLLNISDLVICTARQLYNEKIKVNSNTFFIPNAADLEHSSKALEESLPISEKLSSIRRPIIGYFGNIERRMDFELLGKLAHFNRENSFVFVGPVDENYVPEEFRLLENVHFLGKAPYADMPSFLKGFDVAMIPFKKDEVSATIFPLKLFEYLGAGKPVVATDFNPDLKDHTGDVVRYCRDETEFSEAIKLSLKLASNRDEINKRLVIASKNTWDKRLGEFSDLLADYYEKHAVLNY